MSGCQRPARPGEIALLSLVLLLSGGCHHRQTKTLVLPPPAPVPLDNGGTPTAVLPPPPKPKLPDVPVAEAATQPKKVKKHAAKTTAAAAPVPAPPAAQGTSATPPPGGAPAGPASEAAAAAGATTAASAGSASAIGALTAGSEQNPKTMQEAAELISSNERRLSSLTSQLAQAQASLVSKVRTFQRAAQQALGTGDAEGARTLAMKGKLLLDDLLGSGS